MKRKIIIISTIVVLILIFVFIVKLPKDRIDLEHMNPTYFGDWEITGVGAITSFTPLDMEQEIDDHFVDSRAKFSEKIAIFDEKKIEKPDYGISDLNKKEFFHTYGINLVDIGIYARKVRVVEVKGFNTMRLIVKNSKELLIFYNKGFLELSRVSP